MKRRGCRRRGLQRASRSWGCLPPETFTRGYLKLPKTPFSRTCLNPEVILPRLFYPETIDKLLRSRIPLMWWPQLLLASSCFPFARGYHLNSWSQKFCRRCDPSVCADIFPPEFVCTEVLLTDLIWVALPIMYWGRYLSGRKWNPEVSFPDNDQLLYSEGDSSCWKRDRFEPMVHKETIWAVL